MPRTRIAALAALLTLLPLPALARPQSPAPPCDVAVWTGAHYEAVDLGLMMPNWIVTGPGRPEINSEEAIRKMLPSALLFEAAAKSRLPAILGREVNFIHVDSTLKQSDRDRTRRERSSPSTNPCYIELYFVMVHYQASAAYGERLYTLYVIRDFRGPKRKGSTASNFAQLPGFSKQTVEGATETARRALSEGLDTIAAKRFGPR